MPDAAKKGMFGGLLSRLRGDSGIPAVLAPVDEPGHTIPIFQQRRIFVPTPEGWTHQAEGGALSMVPTFSVTSASNEVKVMLSVFSDMARKMDSLEAIESLTRLSWEQFPDRQTAVDKVLRLEKASNGHGKAVWHTYTDGALVGRPIPPNQWLHVTKGIRAWGGMFLQFTVLSNSLESAEYRRGRDIALSGVREATTASPN